jgi:hypothetical protein
LLSFNIDLFDRPLATDGEASDTAGPTEVPVGVPTKASIIFQSPSSEIQRAEDHEIVRGINEADVEDGHLVAGGAVALVDEVAGRWGLSSNDRRESKIGRIGNSFAMA